MDNFHDVEIIDLTEEKAADYPDGKPWMVITHESHAVFLESEDKACEVQRYWRALHGRDEMTGEPCS